MSARRSISRLWALLGAFWVVAACDLMDSAVPSSTLPPTEPTQPSLPEPSQASRELSVHFAKVQADLISQGLLRTDSGRFSAPYGARELAENFTRIALYDEYTQTGGRVLATPRRSTLRRWESPIRLSVEFGDTVSLDKRRKDLRDIKTYATRLSRLTGLSISIGDSDPNFHVLILNEDERLAYGPRIQSLVPGISATSVRSIIDMPRGRFCLLSASSGPQATASYHTAIAVIRAEHSNRMRLSCIHEELAQGLGLTNDSPAARPSIFNDDEEFALLTPHDEQLLRILYDPRLKIGMTEAQATPIVREIVAELLAGS